MLAKVGQLLQTEFDHIDVSHFYYTKNKVVLGYILNDSTRFNAFVANTVKQIHQSTKVCNGITSTPKSVLRMLLLKVPLQLVWLLTQAVFVAHPFLWNEAVCPAAQDNQTFKPV